MENTYTVKLPTLEDMNSFVNICSQFEEDIDYRIGRYIVDAKSVMGIHVYYTWKRSKCNYLY